MKLTEYKEKKMKDPEFRKTYEKMKNDLISRQEAIESLGEEPEVWSGKDEYEMGLNNQWHYDRNAIMTVPAQERKKGKWIISKMPVTGAIEHRCSECDTPYYMAFCFQMNYCPNCGTEMKGEQDDAVLDNRASAQLGDIYQQRSADGPDADL